MSFLNILFEDFSGLLIVVAIFILCILYAIIKGMILFIPKKIAEHRLSEQGGFKVIFHDLLERIVNEYPYEKHCYYSLSATIGNIKVSFLFNTLKIYWRDKKWKYNVDDIVCPISRNTKSKQCVIGFGESKIIRDYRTSQVGVWKEILSDIMLSQSLAFTKNAEGSMKRSLTINRLLAYEYEDLLYEAFQDGIYYTDQHGYSYDGYSFGKITREELLEKIKIAKGVDLLEAEKILQLFEDKHFVWNNNNSYTLSDFFTHYWNIITIEDNNINKWARKHNFPKRTFEEASKNAGVPSFQYQHITYSRVKHDAVEIAEEVKEAHSPLYTIYRAGPEMLTYSYPVDTKPYKEIYEEDGIIGPSKYAQYPDALDALRENENDWFILEDNRKPIRDLVVKDLLTLAKQHNMPGAYSLIGSLCDRRDEMMKYWKLGLTAGNMESMVAYGMMQYCEGRTAEGFQMMKQGADAGEKLGCFLCGVSFQYGTLSEIDLNKAAEYYLKSVGKENDFYTYLNIGSILVESGYYHTALHYFEKMLAEYKKDPDEIRQFGHHEEYLSNLETCRELLKFPYPERNKRMVLQQHARTLDSIFCADNKLIAPVVPEHVSKGREIWNPSADQIDIDPLDLEERSAVPEVSSKRETDEKEDYMFLSIPVTIDNPEIYGTQAELIFLEKQCHAELNKYIQDNLIALRSALKSLGYLLTYLPAHSHNLIDDADKIGSYHNDYGKEMWNTLRPFGHKTTESEYWHSLVPESNLPDDCAGFLRYVPNLNNLEDHTHYEYILFPFRPGTDWPRAFRTFIKLMRGKPIVPIYNIEEENKLYLPSGSIFDITPDYDFVLRDNADSVIANVNMPTLSKVVYLGLLNHPEGIIIKSLIDYKDELWSYYLDMAGDKAKIENIETLCDPTNNSIHEKISRIRTAFTKALGNKYPEELPSFIPTGKRGEAYSVSVDRSRIRQRGKKYAEKP